MNSWNGLDFFIFLIIFINTIQGSSRGASREIISMMCLSLSLIFAIKFTIPLQIFLNSSPMIQDVLSTAMVQRFMGVIGAGPLTANLLSDISFCFSLLICFFGVFYTCEGALNFSGMVEVFTFPYAAASRKVGAGLGATRGYIFSLILIVLAIHIFTRNEVNDEIKNSFLTSHFVILFTDPARKLDEIVASQAPDSYQQIYKYKKFNEESVYQQLQAQS